MRSWSRQPRDGGVGVVAGCWGVKTSRKFEFWMRFPGKMTGHDVFLRFYVSKILHLSFSWLIDWAFNIGIGRIEWSQRWRGRPTICDNDRTGARMCWDFVGACLDLGILHDGILVPTPKPLGRGFKYVLFSPLFGEDSQVDYRII